MKTTRLFSIAFVVMLCFAAASDQAQAQTPRAGSNQAGDRTGAGGETQLANQLAQARPPRRGGFALMPASHALKAGGPLFNITPAAAPNLPVIGSGTLGRLTKWTGFTSSNSVIGNSTIFEDKDGLVGIGTDSPTSRLTVVGTIAATGGFKFPTGAHDATLKGDGTVSSPLGVAVPLNLTGTSSSTILSATNISLGSGIGIIGSSLNGDGINGTSFALDPTAAGVEGNCLLCIGVRGESGIGTGVFGSSDSGDGMRGTSSATNQTVAGVRGKCDSCTGVSGESTSGTGVFGESQSATGVSGRSTNSFAVSGLSTNGVGVFGSSLSSVGVEADTSSTDPTQGALHANSSGRPTGAIAARFRGKVSIENYTVFSMTQPGDLVVAGKLQVTSGMKMFHIDHPLDPENKYLNHAAIESSEVLNVYSGNIITNADGEAVVTLPDWFEALNKDFRYQLTVVGTFAQAIVGDEIKNNRFAIKTNAANVKVSWQVTGVRSDPTARKYKFDIEEEKPKVERGFYLNPDAFGQSEEKSIQWARDPEGMKLLRQKHQEAEQMRDKQKDKNQ